MKRILILTALGLALVIASVTHVSAEELESYQLHGEYAYVGSRVCVQNINGFTAFPELALIGNGSARTAHSKGVLQLNRNGTGTLVVKTMQVYHHLTLNTQKPVDVWVNNCKVEYERLPSGTIEMNIFNCAGPFVAGTSFPGTSGNFSDATETMSGEVSTNKNVILFSDTEPNVETPWMQPEGGGTFYRKRLCTRSYTAILRR